MSKVPAYIWLVFTLRLAMAGESLLVNGDFELGEKGFSALPANVRMESFVGYEGTAAMVFERPHPAARDVAVTQELNVHAGGFYTLKALVKCDRLTGAPLGIGVEFWQKKNALHAAERQARGPLGTCGWREITLDFTVPPEATAARLVIALPAKATGTLWLDRMTLQEGDYPFQLAIVSPLQGELASAQTSLRLAIRKPGEQALVENLMHFTLQVQIQGRQILRAAAPVVDIPLERPITGRELEITAELLERGKSRSVAKLHERLRLPVATIPPRPRTVRFDARGFTVLDGNPLFPAGIAAYTEKNGQPDLPLLASRRIANPLENAEDLDKLFENAQQPQPMIVLPLRLVQDKSAGRLGDEDSFSIDEQLLGHFSRKPSLLAWLATDDFQPGNSRVRTSLHDFDPHPLVRMLPQGAEPTRFIADADVLLAPFEAPDRTQPHTALLRARHYARELSETGLPCWALVKAPLHGETSPETLRVLSILLVMRGIRGIYFDAPLKDHAEEVLRLLQEIEPCLGGSTPKELPLELAKGEAAAMEFTGRQGRRMILLVGGLDGKKTTADFTLPPGTRVTSRHGHTRQKRDGSWRFQGKGVLCDILEISAK